MHIALKKFCGFYDALRARQNFAKSQTTIKAPKPHHNKQSNGLTMLSLVMPDALVFNNDNKFDLNPLIKIERLIRIEN